MKLAKNLLLCVLSVLLVSCDSLEGVLTAGEELNFVDRRGRDVTVAPGEYAARVQFNSRRRITLRLNQNDSEQKVRFNMPNGVQLGENQTITVPSVQTGQAYDLVAINVTETTTGSVQWGREQCSVQVPVRRCYTNSQGQTVCRTYYETRWGWRDSQYRVERKVGANTINFNSPGTQDSAGDFVAQFDRSRKVYVYTGRCFVGGYPYPFL